VHVGVHGHLREFPSSLLREPLLAGQLSRHLPGIYLLGRYGAPGGRPIRCHQGLGELLGRPVYPLLLLSVQSALSPVLRALTSRGYLLGGGGLPRLASPLGAGLQPAVYLRDEGSPGPWRPSEAELRRTRTYVRDRPDAP